MKLTDALLQSNIGTCITTNGVIIDSVGFHYQGEAFSRSTPIMEVESDLLKHGVECRPLNTSDEQTEANYQAFINM